MKNNLYNAHTQQVMVQAVTSLKPEREGTVIVSVSVLQQEPQNWTLKKNMEQVPSYFSAY